MARINKVLIVFLHFGTPWPYFVCALCQFIAFGTRRDNTLYVRCATFRTLAHAATILCMCVVPLSALRHTSRQYSVCAKCRFSRSDTRRGHTLYVRCANLSHLAHAAAILCMCVVPLSALRHTSRQYSVCALCRFSRSGTRPDHTLYVRCANFRAPAHAATILCMCHVPLFALRHTPRQE